MGSNQGDLGMDNRTTALRVLGSAKSTRLELRVPGCGYEPLFKAMAATVASGLYGIENETRAATTYDGNGYAATDVEVLPANLQDAASG